MNVDQIAVPANRGDLVAVLLAGEPDETRTVTVSAPLDRPDVSGMVHTTVRFGSGTWAITWDADQKFQTTASWHDHDDAGEASECMRLKVEDMLGSVPAQLARFMGASLSAAHTTKEAPEGVIEPSYPHGWSSV